MSISLFNISSTTHPKHLWKKKGQGGIMDIYDLPKVLLDHGTVLEKHCPLSETLQVTRLDADEKVTVYRPSKVRVRSLCDKEFEDDVDRFHRFHGSLVHQIEVGCAAARIPIYPSYAKLKGKEIYCPSKAELKKDELHGHIVLFTGYGCDENNKVYYQFQETAGTSVGDQGQVAADGYGIQITTIMEV
ncbi:uncharacterized protein LOC106414942 isoform X6 [Brassica napus]|uniref:uncharacterized protein LOC106414942 isoform X6 n=1 Tax=Brassica napus TaxID=3708 RepID=UPI000BBE4D37|nr:uncharacterized protein LOC106414942 isoform X6 [Brassica napus]